MARAEDIAKEKELIKRFKKGDQAARAELHRRMDSVVESVVRKYGAMTGLSMEAVRMDAHRLIDGYFLSYDDTSTATPATWVRANLEKKIMLPVRESQLVRAPEKVSIKVPHFVAAQSALKAEFLREPTDQEIHRYIVNVLGKSNVTLRDVTRIRELRRTMVPASVKMGDGGESSLSIGDMSFSQETAPVSALDQFKESQMKTLLSREINNLPFKERDIIRHYYGLDGYMQMSLRALAVKYGVSKSTVDRLVEDTEQKLRQRIGGGIL